MRPLPPPAGVVTCVRKDNRVARLVGCDGDRLFNRGELPYEIMSQRPGHVRDFRGRDPRPFSRPRGSYDDADPIVGESENRKFPNTETLRISPATFGLPPCPKSINVP